MATPAPSFVEDLFSVKGLVAVITGGGTGKQRSRKQKQTKKASIHELLHQLFQSRPFVFFPPSLTRPKPKQKKIGIGLMMAKALAEAGAARVYIVGRRVDLLQEAAASIGRPSVVVPLYCDVTSKVSLESIVSVVETDMGYVNLVVCNAGVGGPEPGPPTGPAAATTLAEWRDAQMAVDFEDFTNTFRVNSAAVWFTAVAFLKLLDAGNRRGNMPGVRSQVVVTSSIAGFNKMAPGGWAYGPSKAAATHIAKMLSVVLPKWGIRWVPLRLCLLLVSSCVGFQDSLLSY